MSEDPEARASRTWEITIASDRATTVGMVFLLLICGVLLVREIRHFIWGRLSLPPHLHRRFWSIWNSAFDVIAAALCFMVSLKLQKKSAKLAGVLIGAYLASSFSLSCLRLASGAQQVAATLLSALFQIALAASCIAIAAWFESVVSRGRARNPEGGGI
jgi:hypothetical protein